MKKYLLTIFLLIFSFVGLLMLSFVFNDNKIKENVYNSIKNYNFYDNKKMNITVDNYTDMIIMNVATYNSNDSIINRTFKNEYGILYVDKYGDKEINWNMHENLKASLNNYNHDSVFYGRYWHGCLFFVKFLLSFFTYQQSLIFLLVIGIALIIFSIYLILKKLDWKSLIVYLISLISLGVYTLGTCYQYFFTFILMIIAVIVLLLKYHSKFDYKLYFFVIGAISSYVLYVSFPLITLAFPLILLLLFKLKNNDLANYKNNILIIFYSCLYWIIGYILLFASKWILGTIFVGENFITNALISVNQRLGISFPFNYFDVLKLNFIEFFSHIENIIFCVVCLILIVLKIRKDTIIKLKIISPFIFVLILPFIWMFFANNHSAIHYWMIFRLLSIIVLSLLSICVVVYNKNVNFDNIQKLNINDFFILIECLLFIILYNYKIIFIIVSIVLYIIFIKKIHFKVNIFIVLLILFSSGICIGNYVNKEKLSDEKFFQELYNEVYHKVIFYGEQYMKNNIIGEGEKVDIKKLINDINPDSVFLLSCNGYITSIDNEIKPYLNCNGITIDKKD